MKAIDITIHDALKPYLVHERVGIGNVGVKRMASASLRDAYVL